MKTLFRIRIHSYVNLISNSSSELFVCSTDKTVQVVKKVVEEIYKNWYDNVRDPQYTYPHVTEIWKLIFQEPTVAEYVFNWYAFPNNLKDEFLKYNEDNFKRRAYYRIGFGQETGYEAGATYKNLQKKEREVRNAVHDKYGYTSASKMYDEDPPKYKMMNQEENEECHKIWKKWAIKKSKAEIAMVKWFLEFNGVALEEMPVFVENDHRWGGIRVQEGGHTSERVLKLIEFMGECESWGYNVKVGDIFIQTVRDNSAPYEIFGAIESMLNAVRRHLG